VLYRNSIRAIALAGALLATMGAAQAFDESKYPDWKGQWRRGDAGGARYDPSKPREAQQAPLTEEYKAIHAASIADQAAGGQGNDPTYTCVPPGMPRIMNIYDPMEIIITPSTTHIMIQHIHDSRRIFTDGRDWPKGFEPTFAGYSLGKWIDQDGDGKHDVLEVETRHLKGPRPLDPAGMPTHEDNKSIVKERIYLSKAVPGYLHDEITLIDNAFTQPWTVLKTYARNRAKYPEWQENVCASENVLVKIAKETYFRGSDGNLMPTRKGQPAPDVRYFQQTPK